MILYFCSINWSAKAISSCFIQIYQWLHLWHEITLLSTFICYLYVLMQDATRGSHVVILLADGMREIAEEDRAPPMIGGSMFPPTLIGSTGNVPCQLVVVAIGEHNYKSIAKSHHTNGNRYPRLVMVAARNRRLLGCESSCPFCVCTCSLT